MVAKRRHQQSAETNIAQAWQTANLTAAASVGKLPKLKELLDKMKANRLPLAEQSRATQQATIYDIAARFGGTVKKTRLRRIG